MLCLREQVCRYPFGIPAHCKNDSFRRASGKVDGAIAVYELFCGSNKAIARPKDFIHARDGFRAIGERGDGLRTADAGDLRYAKQICGGEKFWIWFWTNHGDVRDARDLCGDDSHEERGDESEPAAGNVAADGVDGTNELRDDDAGLDLERPGLRELFLGDAADVR